MRSTVVVEESDAWEEWYSSNAKPETDVTPSVANA
jgi:hypothetical protein